MLKHSKLAIELPAKLCSNKNEITLQHVYIMFISPEYNYKVNILFLKYYNLSYVHEFLRVSFLLSLVYYKLCTSYTQLAVWVHILLNYKLLYSFSVILIIIIITTRRWSRRRRRRNIESKFSFFFFIHNLHFKWWIFSLKEVSVFSFVMSFIYDEKKVYRILKYKKKQEKPSKKKFLFL